jgi:hypothetical protein
LFLIAISLICLGGDLPAVGPGRSLVAAASPDSLLGLVRNIPVEIKNEINYRKIRVHRVTVSYPEDFMPFRGYVPEYNPSEGVFYLPYAEGRSYPLFPVERYRIINDAWEIVVFDLEDPYDRLLEYVGLYIIDNTSRRRCICDSISLQPMQYLQVIKK